jgi:tripartite-type tricarboxylate transporter receptor subunit TctC
MGAEMSCNNDKKSCDWLVAAAALLSALSTLFSPGTAFAQGNYPDRSIRIVSINAPGGPADLLARLIGDKLSASFGKPVVVEGMPGAGGSLAAAHVAKAAPDGYTLLMSGDAALVTNISLYNKLTYDPVKDLAPISQLVATPNVLVVPADLPVKSVADLVALGRSKPATFTFAHGGLGFSTHLSGEMFKTMSQVDMQQVMFRTSVYPDLIAGRVTMCFCNISQALPLARENKLRALAVSSPKRSPAAPDLPTMDESGFAGFDVTSWFALMAPAGTPQPVVEKLHGEVVRILAMPDTRQKLADLGMEMIGSSPAELAAVIKTQMPQRAKLIKDAGVKMQ